MSRKRTLFLFTCIFMVSAANFLSYADDSWPNGGGESTSSDDSKGSGDDSKGSNDTKDSDDKK